MKEDPAMYSPNDPTQNNTEWYISEKPKARLGKGIIGQIRYSPDGTQLAVGSSIGIWIYNAHTGKELNLLTGHTEWPNCIAYSPDGNMLASGGGILGSNSYKICLWDPNTGEHKAILGEHEGFVTCIEFSPDGSILASGSIDETIQLWDVATAKHKATLKGHTGGTGGDGVMSFSPDGLTLVSATDRAWTTKRTDDKTKKEIRLWDTETGQQKVTLEKPVSSVVKSIAFSPDGDMIVGGGWDIIDRPHPSWEEDYTSPGTIQVWDVATGERKTTLKVDTRNVFTVTYSPNGSFLVSGSAENTILLWDATTYELKESLTGDPYAIAFSPDSKTLAIGDNKKIKLWDTVSGEYKKTLTDHTDDVCNLIFNPVDGRTFAGIGADSTIRLWDAVTGEHLQTIAGHTRTISSISFNADGSKLATGSGHGEGTHGDNTIRIYNVHSRQLQNTIKVSTGRGTPIDSVSYSPDGKTIASVDGHGTIRHWNVESGIPQLITFEDCPDNSANPDFCDSFIQSEMEEELRAIIREQIHDHKLYVGVNFAYSPDGETIAIIKGCYTGSNIVDTIQLLDAATCRLKVTLTGPLSSLFSIAFSPDSRTIAGGSDSGDVLLWDATTGKLKIALTEHNGRVYSVAFSPDGRTLASGAGEVCLWDLVSRECKVTLHTGWAPSVAFSPDGSILAVGGNESVTLLDVRKVLYLSDNDRDVYPKKTDIIASLTRHKGFVSSVAFSPNECMLASGGKDGTILLWDITKTRPTPQVIAQQSIDSTVHVQTSRWDHILNAAEGNGFFIGQGLVVTQTHLWDYAAILKVSNGNAFVRLFYNIFKCLTFWNIIAKNHVIKETNVSSLTISRGRYPYLIGPKLNVERIAAIDGRLVILKVSDSDIQPLSLSNDDVQIGDTVYVASSPGNSSDDISRFSQGIISGFFDERDTQTSLFEITAPIPAGCNGCPVLNSKGQVIGMGVAAMRTRFHGQNLYYAIPSFRLRDLLLKVED